MPRAAPGRPGPTPGTPRPPGLPRADPGGTPRLPRVRVKCKAPRGTAGVPRWHPGIPLRYSEPPPGTPGAPRGTCQIELIARMARLRVWPDWPGCALPDCTRLEVLPDCQIDVARLVPDWNVCQIARLIPQDWCQMGSLPNCKFSRLGVPYWDFGMIGRLGPAGWGLARLVPGWKKCHTTRLGAPDWC